MAITRPPLASDRRVSPAVGHRMLAGGPEQSQLHRAGDESCWLSLGEWLSEEGHRCLQLELCNKQDQV